MGGMAGGPAALVSAVGLLGMGNPHRLAGVKPGRTVQGEAQQRGPIQILLQRGVQQAALPSVPCPSRLPKSLPYGGEITKCLPSLEGAMERPCRSGCAGAALARLASAHSQQEPPQCASKPDAAFAGSRIRCTAPRGIAALAFVPAIPGRLLQDPTGKALLCPLLARPWPPVPPCQRARPTPRTTQRGCK